MLFTLRMADEPTGITTDLDKKWQKKSLNDALIKPYLKAMKQRGRPLDAASLSFSTEQGMRVDPARPAQDVYASLVPAGSTSPFGASLVVSFLGCTLPSANPAALNLQRINSLSPGRGSSGSASTPLTPTPTLAKTQSDKKLEPGQRVHVFLDSAGGLLAGGLATSLTARWLKKPLLKSVLLPVVKAHNTLAKQRLQPPIRQEQLTCTIGGQVVDPASRVAAEFVAQPGEVLEIRLAVAGAARAPDVEAGALGYGRRPGSPGGTTASEAGSEDDGHPEFEQLTV